MPHKYPGHTLLLSSLLWCLVSQFVPVPGFADTPIYTYKDDAGTSIFTTELYTIPEKYRSRAVPLDTGTSPYGVPGPQKVPVANVQVVTASGEYQMGDHDTRADAIRLATEAAKRNALEQVATYLESVTEVSNLDVTKDEIRTYTAGVVIVLDQTISTRLEGQTVVIHADLTAQVDPTEVAQAITALRENESAKTELVALRTEVDQLQQELDVANQSLATATSPDQIQAITQQRQQLLNQLQTNALVSQAWTDWVYVTPIVYPYRWIGVQQVHGLLLQARQLSPMNRHLQIMQHVVTTQAGPLPAAPPVGSPSPVPPHASLLVLPPPPQQHVPPPLSSPSISSPGPPDVHHVNPLTVPPSHLVPLPPTLQQVHPPHFAQPGPPVLRAPFSAPSPAPRMSAPHFGGGGGHSGGGGHRGR